MTHYGPALTSPRSPPTMYRESGTSNSGRNFTLTESPVMPQKMSLIKLRPWQEFSFSRNSLGILIKGITTQYFLIFLPKNGNEFITHTTNLGVPVPRGVLTKYPGVHLQRPDEHECIVGSLNHDAGQAGADRLDSGLRVHVEGADLVPH